MSNKSYFSTLCTSRRSPLRTVCAIFIPALVRLCSPPCLYVPQARYCSDVRVRVDLQLTLPSFRWQGRLIRCRAEALLELARQILYHCFNSRTVNKIQRIVSVVDMNSSTPQQAARLLVYEPVRHHQRHELAEYGPNSI